MRILLSPLTIAGLVCGLLSLIGGCGNPSAQSLEFLAVTATPATVNVGSAVTLHAVVHFGNGTTQDVTSSTRWSLSNSSLATLSNGVLTSKAPGTLSVQGAYVSVLPAGQAGTDVPAVDLSASAQVTINGAASAPGGTVPSISWNTPSSIQYGTALSSVQLNAVANVPGSFAYTPAAGAVLQAGSQKITAVFTPSDTTAYSAANAAVELTVSQTSPMIAWAPLSPIQLGTALSAVQLDATANVPGTFSYSPALGAVLPAGVQQLSVTFTPSDATDYTPAMAHDLLTVTAASTSSPVVTWNVPAPIQYGSALTSVQLNAVANVAGNFVYSPAAGAVLQAGTQKLTAIFTPSDTATYSTATAAVQLTVTQAKPLVTWAPLSPIQQGTALSGVQLDATVNVPGTFSYSPAAGTVLPAGTQQLTATFTPTNATDYSSAMVFNSLTVNSGSPTGSGINGACGPANGTTSSVAPTANLCSVGTPSAVTGTGPWTWQCAGSNGGTTSSCKVSPLTPEGVSAFVQSLGINTHVPFPGTPYYDHTQNVLSALQYLGISTVRDQPPAFTTDPNTVETNNTLAAAGIKFDVVLVGSNGPVDITDTLTTTAAFKQSYPGSIAAIEGPNEINTAPITYQSTTNTYIAGVQVTEALWAAVQANTSLSGVPIYALTLAGGQDGVPAEEAELGNLASYVTYSNAHIYASQSDNVWDYNMPYWLPIFEADTPGKPMIITETGYATMPGSVDEVSAAKYNLNTLCENALNGIVRTYLYQLADFNSSATDTNPDDHMGQFNDDWTPKAGATAIHNLTTILQSAGSGTASSTLNYSVTGLPTTGHSFLFGSTTAFDIAVWVDATVYDPTNDTEIAPPAYSLTVNLGATFANVAVYDPMIGTTPTATYSDVSSLSISVTDHPLIVQVN